MGAYYIGSHGLQQTEILFRCEQSTVLNIIYSIIILLPSPLRLRPVLTAKPIVVQYMYIISVIIVYRGICPWVRVLYDILTWERRFDKWSSSGRSSPHTCKPEMTKNTHTSGSSVKVNAGGGGDGHTRRLIPMANRNNFTKYYYYFRTCHCRAAALGTISYYIIHIIT